MKKQFLNAMLIILVCMLSINNLQAQSPPIPGNWELTFEDNFDGNSLDPAKWTTGGTHFNGIAANYPSNITVRNGNVEIKGEKRPLIYVGENYEYVGSEITTFQKFRQKYGYFEARFKYDAVRGAFPAFWTMPDRGYYGNPDQNRESYLKFDLSNRTAQATTVKLKIMVKEFTNSPVYSDVSIHRLLSNNWNEESITWNNKPDFDPVWLALFTETAVVGKINEITIGEYLVIDVTDYINNQIASSENAGFAIVDLSMRSNLFKFGSKESAMESDRPRLEIDGTNIFTSDDAYVRAGVYADDNYGSLSELEVLDPWASTSSTFDGGMEKDIMESLGMLGDNIAHHGVHWDGYDEWHKNAGSGDRTFPATADGYHVYAMNWQPGRIDYYIDGLLSWTFENSRVGSVDSYMLLSHQLGGWNGNENPDDANLPITLTADYVRVYKKNASDDKITFVSGPLIVAQEEVLNVFVAYEATASRDITTVFRLNEAPFTEYTSSTKSVSAGIGSEEITLTIPSDVPEGANYSYKAFITPTGGNWSNSLHDTLEAPIEVMLKGSNDKINSVSGPSQVTQGEVITVSIDYGATDYRNVQCSFQLDEAPWTVYAAGRKSVGKGLGTTEITFTLPDNVPGGTNYYYNTFIMPSGGNWNTRLDDMGQSPVEVLSNASPKDTIITVTGLSEVSPGANVMVTVDYEATTERDITCSFQLDESPWTEYTSVTKSVSAGVGSEQLIINIPSNVPIGTNYRYQTFITPIGGNWSNRLNDMNQAPVEVREGVDDKIISINGPSQVSQGESITVSVNYEVSKNRDIKCVLQLNEAPWTTYIAVTKSVSKGVGTEQITLTIPSDVPIGANYQYQTIISPTGGNWFNRLDDMKQSPVEVTTIVDISIEEEIIPKKFSVANYPNPFNPSTTIHYNLPESGFVVLTIYDITGKRVLELVNEQKSAGSYTATWEAKNMNGRNVTSGIYLYQIRYNEQILTNKMLYLR